MLMNIMEQNNEERYRQEGYIPVKTRKETTKVSVREILYIESELRVVVIYTSERTYRFYGRLDELIQYLSSDFYRVHKSCAINMDFIERMEGGIIFLQGGHRVQVGQNNFRLARSHYHRFLERNVGQNALQADQVCENGRGFE